MKPTLAFVVLVAWACAGSDGDSDAAPVVGPITPPPVAVVDSCAVGRPNFGSPATSAELSLFGYDVEAPLNLQKTVESATAGVEVSAIAYDSPAGGRVTGMLFTPLNRSTPRPGIVLMHGMPSRARDMIPFASTLARYGAVVIAIDAPFARRAGPSLRMTKQDRDEQIQLMKDLQRAVDVLRARADVDKERIAYVGVSYGGAMGALFVGIERRLKAAALIVADGGLVTHATAPQALPFLGSLSCATRVAWLREMAPIEPIRFVGLARPTPLLLQNGRTDTLVPEADAQSLHGAASEPKTILWYNAGHALTQQAALDRHNWLVERIGLDPL